MAHCINPKFTGRKDLIHIITDKFDDSIPKEYKLMEMGNDELLNIIKDDMFVIAHMKQKWTKEEPEEEFPEQTSEVLTTPETTKGIQKEVKKDNKNIEKKEIQNRSNKNKPFKKK